MQKNSARQIRRVLRLKQVMRLAQIFCALLIMLTLALPAAAAKKRSHKKKIAPKKETPASGKYVRPALQGDSLANEMLKHLGVKYRPGGSGPGGVDCSGFVGLVYRNTYGMELPHQSTSLYISSELQKIEMDELRTGDLLFFTSGRKGRRINHVGIYLSDGEFVHAASGKGVVVSSLDQPHWSARVAGARRVPEVEPLKRKGAAEPTFEFASLSSGMEGPGSGTFLDYSEGFSDSDKGRFLGMDVGGDLAFNLSLFRDSLLSLSGTGAEAEDPYLREIIPAEPPLSAYVQGVRLEKPIRPSDWLVVTPFLSYFNYDGRIDETGLPRRSMGVDVAFGSVKEGWKVSTGIKMLSLIPARGLPEDERAAEGFDMSLAYSTRITDTMSISLIGERIKRYELDAPDISPQEKSQDDQRFSILFNFSY